MRQLMEVLGKRLSPASKVDASSARGGDTFGLPLADVLSFTVRYEGD